MLLPWLIFFHVLMYIRLPIFHLNSLKFRLPDFTEIGKRVLHFMLLIF